LWIGATADIALHSLCAKRLALKLIEESIKSN
jgi:hypothetical protein